MAFEKVIKYLKEYNLDNKVIVLNTPIPNVCLASLALNVSEGEIAKTLSFKDKDSCMLIVMSGDALIDNRKFINEFCFKAKMLSFEETLKYTNHQVGGVCPFAINDNVNVYLDTSLKRYRIVYPGCGDEYSVIPLTIDELYLASHAIKWVDVTKLKQ